MNEFTKDELEYIRNNIFKGASCISFYDHEILKNKIQSMIDNFEGKDSTKRIANAHLANAASAIDYAIFLLNMKNGNDDE